jgi:O-acetylhomoserine (thiol)-lyase
MQGFATRAIHGGSRHRDIHGALRTPVYDNVAFEHDSARSLSLAFSGKAAHITRISNPRWRTLNSGCGCLGRRRGAGRGLGHGAISTTILTLAEAGANIVTSRHLFGNTLSLLEKTLRPWGLEVRYADMTDPATVAAAIDSSTRAVLLESITNPQLEVADCTRLAQVTQKQGVPLLVDNTLLTRISSAPAWPGSTSSFSPAPSTSRAGLPRWAA